MDDRGAGTVERWSTDPPERVRASFLAGEIDANEATRRLLALSKQQRSALAPPPSPRSASG
jgi:hypothetical protein